MAHNFAAGQRRPISRFLLFLPSTAGGVKAHSGEGTIVQRNPMQTEKKQWVLIPSRFCALICLGILIAATTSAWRKGQSSTRVQRPTVSDGSSPTAEEHDADKKNLLLIYKALKSYEKEHGKLPDWLSDLVPKYIQDSNVLVSPFFLRTGKEVLYGNEDPHLKTSYIYEFSAKPIPAAIRGAFPNLPDGMTMKEWKTKQVAEFGRVVPIVRCFLYDPVLNVSSDGEFFESGAYWETDPKTLELRKKRMGAGSKTATKNDNP